MDMIQVCFVPNDSVEDICDVRLVRCGERCLARIPDSGANCFFNLLYGSSVDSDDRNLAEILRYAQDDSNLAEIHRYAQDDRNLAEIHRYAKDDRNLAEIHRYAQDDTNLAGMLPLKGTVPTPYREASHSLRSLDSTRRAQARAQIMRSAL